MLCMLYTIAVGTCLALAGLLLERALPPAWPRRWIWCSTLVLSIVVPPLYRARHNVALAAITPSDAGWWVFRSWDAPMMRAWGVASILLILLCGLGASAMADNPIVGRWDCVSTDERGQT